MQSAIGCWVANRWICIGTGMKDRMKEGQGGTETRQIFRNAIVNRIPRVSPTPSALPLESRIISNRSRPYSAFYLRYNTPLTSSFICLTHCIVSLSGTRQVSRKSLVCWAEYSIAILIDCFKADFYSYRRHSTLFENLNFNLGVFLIVWRNQSNKWQRCICSAN